MGFPLLCLTDELVVLFHDVLRVCGFAPGWCVGFPLLRLTDELVVLFHDVLRVYGFAPGWCVGFPLLCLTDELVVSFHDVTLSFLLISFLVAKPDMVGGCDICSLRYCWSYTSTIYNRIYDIY